MPVGNVACVSAIAAATAFASASAKMKHWRRDEER